MNQLLLRLATIATVFFAALGFRPGALRSSSAPASSTLPPATPTPSRYVAATPSAGIAASPVVADIAGFPVYPGAKLKKKAPAPQCEGPLTGFSICDAVIYTWTTSDDGDAVSAWYHDHKSGSGWVCDFAGGEYVSPRNFSGVQNCTRGSLHYRIFFTATKKRTTIELVVPTPSP